MISHRSRHQTGSSQLHFAGLNSRLAGGPLQGIVEMDLAMMKLQKKTKGEVESIAQVMD